MTAAARLAASLARAGRPMVLRRRTGTSYIDCALTGASIDYRPEELTGAIVQGDRRIKITQAPLVAAGWPTPPKKNDMIDGATVQGAHALYDGPALIGWVLWVRG